MVNTKIGYTLNKVRNRLAKLVEPLLEDNTYKDTYLTIKNAKSELESLMELMKNEDYNNLKIGKDE